MATVLMSRFNSKGNYIRAWNLEEAKTLRYAGIKSNIVVFSGILPNEVDEAVNVDAIYSVSNMKMLEELKSLKVRLEVAAAAENKNDIQVTKAVDTKDGKKEYRHVKNPTKLTEAKLIYRDTETNEEIVSYDMLQNEEIQAALEERRKMSR